MINRAILKLNSNELHFVRHNIDLEITQQVAPSIFSLRENISKSYIKSNSDGEFSVGFNSVEVIK